MGGVHSANEILQSEPKNPQTQVRNRSGSLDHPELQVLSSFDPIYLPKTPVYCIKQKEPTESTALLVIPEFPKVEWERFSYQACLLWSQLPVGIQNVPFAFTSGLKISLFEYKKKKAYTQE